MRRSGFEIDAAEEEANKNGEEDEDTQNTIHEVIGLVIYQLLVLGVFLQGTAPLLNVGRAKEGLQSVAMAVSGADSFIRVYDLQWWPTNPMSSGSLLSVYFQISTGSKHVDMRLTNLNALSWLDDPEYYLWFELLRLGLSRLTW